MLRIEHLGPAQTAKTFVVCQERVDLGQERRWRLEWEHSPAEPTDPTWERVSLDKLHLFYKRGRSRGAVYGATLKVDEEYHFPYRGQEHFLCVIDGSLQIRERNASKTFTIGKGETCRFSRDALEPLIDIRAIGESLINQVAWVVIHTIVS